MSDAADTLGGAGAAGGVTGWCRARGSSLSAKRGGPAVVAGGGAGVGDRRCWDGLRFSLPRPSRRRGACGAAARACTAATWRATRARAAAASANCDAVALTNSRDFLLYRGKQHTAPREHRADLGSIRVQLGERHRPRVNDSSQFRARAAQALSRSGDRRTSRASLAATSWAAWSRSSMSPRLVLPTMTSIVVGVCPSYSETARCCNLRCARRLCLSATTSAPRLRSS